MIIEVCSQAAAKQLVRQIKESVSVISITSTGDLDVSFPDDTYIESILHLKFNDITDTHDSEGIPYDRPIPKQEDFTGLKEFVSELNCNYLVIHCWEGRSRSAAVARAIYEYREKIDELHSESAGNLNWLVYDLAIRELYGEK